MLLAVAMSSTYGRLLMMEDPICVPPLEISEATFPLDAELKVDPDTEPCWTVFLTVNSSVKPAGVLIMILHSFFIS